MIDLLLPRTDAGALAQAIGAAAGLFRLGMHRLGHRQRPIVVVASVVPFLVFAAGIAIGADWATWH